MNEDYKKSKYLHTHIEKHDGNDRIGLTIINCWGSCRLAQ